MLQTQGKRQAILDAGRRMFITYGYSAVSMDAIADAAPVSKPTLYKHFKGKSALFAAVIEAHCQSLLCALKTQQSQHLDPRAGLTAIAHAFIDTLYTPDALQLYRLMIAEQQQFPELGRLVFTLGAEPVLAQLASYLEELHQQRILCIVDIALATQLFFGMLKGDSHLRCLLGLQSGLSELEKRQLIDASVSLFLKGYGYGE
ncbi:MAG: hypothetical protein RL563_1854 [Pseudomonadota bacterium]|jgi:TetR/AcrR family transcriptional repressor of mexJK operon